MDEQLSLVQRFPSSQSAADVSTPAQLPPPQASAVVQALLELGGKPLIGTSANRSGQPSCRSADAVAEQLGDALDLLVDGGPASETRPSTLVRWDGESFEILREGVLPSSALAPFLLVASGGIPTQASGAGVPPRATRKSGDSQ